MVPADVAFDAAEKHDATLTRVVRVRRRVEVAVVQRDREGAVAERGRPIDELAGRVRNAIRRVLVGVRVKLELDHRAKSSSPWPCARSRPYRFGSFRHPNFSGRGDDAEPVSRPPAPYGVRSWRIKDVSQSVVPRSDRVASFSRARVGGHRRSPVVLCPESQFHDDTSRLDPGRHRRRICRRVVHRAQRVRRLDRTAIEKCGRAPSSVRPLAGWREG